MSPEGPSQESSVMGGAATDGIKVVTPGPLCRQIRGHASHTRGGRFLRRVGPWRRKAFIRRGFPTKCGNRRQEAVSPAFPPGARHRPFFLGVPRLPVTLARQFTAGSVSCGAEPERRHGCRLACPSGPPSPVSRWRPISPAPSPFDPLGHRGGMPPRPQGPSSQHCCRPCGKLDRLAFLL